VSAVAPVGRDPVDERLSAQGALPADEVAVLRRALASLLAHHPDVRGASVYPIAHGEVMVRVFTAHGWAPTLLPAGARRDEGALLARLEAALVGRTRCAADR
jgi:hypothetical protein